MKSRNWVVALVLTLTANILLPHLSWAVDIDVFATINGLKCNGSIADARFKDSIIVRSLSGGVSNVVSTPGGLSGGRASPTPLKIAKDFDQCSPLLFRAGVMNQHFTAVTISFVRPGVNPLVFFEIELTNATVQDLTMGANDALAQTSEEVSFTYQTIRLTDIIIGADGKPTGQVTVECDFVTASCK
jgi:type VI secretion system Hcp family effector